MRQPPPPLVLLLVLAVTAAAAATPLDVCKPVSTAYAVKGLDVLQVQYQPTSAHLRVCTHHQQQRRPTCCTRAMEDALQAKARQEIYKILYDQLVPRGVTLAALVSNLRSLFLQMLNSSHQDLDMSLKSIYGYPYIENKQPFTVFFGELRAYMEGGQRTVAEVTQTLFENIAARVYALIMTNYDIDERYLACVKQQLHSLRPLGQVPDRVGQEFARAFVTARRFVVGLAALQDAVESAPTVRLTDQCQRARLRSHYCAWCDALVGAQPCYGLCSDVLAGCLAPLDPLAEPFDLLVGELVLLTDKVEGPNNLYQVLHQLGLRISSGIMEMQERKDMYQDRLTKACGQPRLKSAEAVAAAPPPASGAAPGASSRALPPLRRQQRGRRRSRRRDRRSSKELYGWSYGDGEPTARAAQLQRLSQLVRSARQELGHLRGLLRWPDKLARLTCLPDAPAPARCWNGTDPAAGGYASPPGGPAALVPPDPLGHPDAAAVAGRAANLRTAHQLAAGLPKSDNFVDFHEARLDPGLALLMRKRQPAPAPLPPSLPSQGGGVVGGGSPRLDSLAVLPGGLAGAGGGGSGSGSAEPPLPLPALPGVGGGGGGPLTLSTLPPPPPPPPRRPQPPTQPPLNPFDPEAAGVGGGSAVSGDSEAPPPPQVLPALPLLTDAPPPRPAAVTTTRQPPPPSATTHGPPVVDHGLPGASGDEQPPPQQPPPSPQSPSLPGGVVVPTPDVVVSGDAEPPSPSADPRQQPPQPPQQPSLSGDSELPLPPVGPILPGATAWPPQPPPPPRTPDLWLPPPQPPKQQPPHTKTNDLWLPKEADEQGGAEKNRGEGSVHSPVMKMTDLKRPCPPSGGVGCAACRPTAAASACSLLLAAAGLHRLLLLLLR